MTLYTIGHSNHPIDHFLALLREHAIDMLVDVRSRPASRWCPHFNRKRLQAALKEASIQYQWRGQFLGGLSDTRVSAEGFLVDMREVLSLAESRNVALMCAERHPRDCHRATKLTAWMHQEESHTPGHHLLPAADGSFAMSSTRVTSKRTSIRAFSGGSYTRRAATAGPKVRWAKVTVTGGMVTILAPK